MADELENKIEPEITEAAEKVADEVKEEVINVAGAMAGKIVASSMSEAEQKRLLDETLKGIGEDTWLNQQ